MCQVLRNEVYHLPYTTFNKFVWMVLKWSCGVMLANIMNDSFFNIITFLDGCTTFYNLNYTCLE